jgi:epoxide hydrolase-like predicted phosphatase
LEINPQTGWPQRWAQRLGCELEAFERRLAEIWGPGSTGELGLEEIERATAAARSGLNDVDLRSPMNDVGAEYVGTLNDELVDYFGGLRARYKTGILSNSFVGAREREHEAYGFGDLCDVIVYSHEEGCLKPDPRIYLTVCDRLDVAPTAAVLINDVQANADGAVAVGMTAITFRDNTQVITDLNALLAAESR